jgi:signal transduction histidine kinase
VSLLRIDDPVKLRRLMSSMLLIEANLALPALLRRLVEEACAMVGARYGALGVLNPDRSALDEFIVVGMDDDEVAGIGSLPTGRGVLGLLISDPRPLRLPDIAAHPESFGFPANHPPMSSFLGVPIKVRDAVYGNLYLTDKVGWGEFTEDDQVLVEALAVSAGIAIENAQLHNRVQELAVLDDRDRIARDLHDAVIQRLFAVGLALQGMVRTASATGLSERLTKAVADIDETIRQIRSTIFELTSHGEAQSLRADVLTLVRELDAITGFESMVRFDGPVDAAVGDEIAQELLSTLREALTNVARHARASAAQVTVSVADGWCTLEVVDDGVGIAASADGGTRTDGGGMGLVNAQRRAEKLKGELAFSVPEGGGTALTWRVPLGR